MSESPTDQVTRLVRDLRHADAWESVRLAREISDAVKISEPVVEIMRKQSELLERFGNPAAQAFAAARSALELVEKIKAVLPKETLEQLEQDQSQLREIERRQRELLEAVSAAGIAQAK
ncbi:MAG: hypothetical protein ABIQ65_13315 [Thermoanaerobaculia bacterium]